MSSSCRKEGEFGRCQKEGDSGSCQKEGDSGSCQKEGESVSWRKAVCHLWEGEEVKAVKRKNNSGSC